MRSSNRSAEIKIADVAASSSVDPHFAYGVKGLKDPWPKDSDDFLSAVGRGPYLNPLGRTRDAVEPVQRRVSVKTDDSDFLCWPIIWRGHLKLLMARPLNKSPVKQNRKQLWLIAPIDLP
jgi:hypothetical protein